jgi:hypothetical protein
MSAPTPAGRAADRALLFGILAFQMGFVSRGALAAALYDLAQSGNWQLGDLLDERGDLTLGQRHVLDLLVAEHIRAQGNDPRRSLAAVAVPPALRGDLRRLEDTDAGAGVAAAGRAPAASQAQPGGTLANNRPTSANTR